MKTKKLFGMASLAAMMMISNVGCASNQSASSTAASSTATSSAQSETTETAKNTEAISSVDVKIKPGTLSGWKQGNVYKFLGVPYATAERFKAPQAIESYADGHQLALSYGTVSPQTRTFSATGEVNASEIMTPSNGTADMVGNENCQNLNVWTNSLEGSKPVIVFFHGGGLSTGASSELSYYTGEHLASEDDVVFVSVNHRLNDLGFLDLSAYGDEYATSGLNGLEDCKVALQWVQDNIESFGGDPKNVTIVGQSGGGNKVTTLASMDDTKDLFDKVVVMSGMYSTVSEAQAKEQVKKLQESLGLSDEEFVPALEKMSYEELYAACRNAEVSTAAPYGIGSFKEPFIDENGQMNENAKARTWMIGSTFSEFSDNTNPLLYYGVKENKLDEITDEQATERLKETYGDQTDALIEAFKEMYPEKPLAEALFLNQFPSSLWSVIDMNSEDGLLDKMSEQGATIYNYVTAYTQPGFGGMTQFHTSDIPFWFDSCEEADYLIAGDEVNAQKVEETMSQALVSFAKTGNPAVADVDWPAWNAKERPTMIFDVTPTLTEGGQTKLYDIVAAAQKAGE